MTAIAELPEPELLPEEPVPHLELVADVGHTAVVPEAKTVYQPEVEPALPGGQTWREIGRMLSKASAEIIHPKKEHRNSRGYHKHRKPGDVVLGAYGGDEALEKFLEAEAKGETIRFH